jgi:hypothetical protein
MIQGYGRHSNQESNLKYKINNRLSLINVLIVFTIAKNDLKAINDYIGIRKYLTSDSPCNEDAALFGVLAQARYQYLGELTEFILNECPNIVRYLDNIKNEFWPDWDANVRNTQIGFFEFLFKFVLSHIF